MTRQESPAAWPPETLVLIEEAKALGQAAAPFPLRSGCTVTDPALFHRMLLIHLEDGSRGARARLGAVQGDLRDYIAARKVIS